MYTYACMYVAMYCRVMQCNATTWNGIKTTLNSTYTVFAVFEIEGLRGLGFKRTCQALEGSFWG